MQLVLAESAPNVAPIAPPVDAGTTSGVIPVSVAPTPLSGPSESGVSDPSIGSHSDVPDERDALFAVLGDDEQDEEPLFSL
jgi:hypothetical protein